MLSELIKTSPRWNLGGASGTEWLGLAPGDHPGGEMLQAKNGARH